MNIKVLGPGCQNCQTLKQNVRAAAEKNGWQTEIEEVTDPAEIVGYGVMKTPALIIGDELVSMGKVLSAQEVEHLWAESLG